MLPVSHDAFQQGTQLRFSPSFAIPFCQHRDGNFDVSPKLIGRMAPQKETVEKGRLALRELKVLHRFFGLWARGYRRVG
jgi:hypothetical protein